MDTAEVGSGLGITSQSDKILLVRSVEYLELAAFMSSCVIGSIEVLLLRWSV